MRGATLITVNDGCAPFDIHSDAVMANSVLQILYKSCKIQKVVLHKQKNRLASMEAAPQNAKYISKQTQNELLQAAAEVILEQITSEIRKVGL